jgi:D-alanine-D-alanine ligase
MNILVLAGGDSAEREVSLSSGAEVRQALGVLGHKVRMLDAGSGQKRLEMLATGQLVSDGDESGTLHASVPAGDGHHIERDQLRHYDCVFIALHGGAGENGTLQAVLDLAGVRYTGSGMFASAVAMDKYRSKIIFEAIGIPTPKLRFFGSNSSAQSFAIGDEAAALTYPVVVKPNAQGSTIGLSIVPEFKNLASAIELAAEYDKEIVIEDYVAGRELTVAILGDEAFPVVEIVPKSGFYDYRAKYTSGECNYICPAPIDGEVAENAREYALRAFRTLGCSGYARIDFRMNQENELFCLELNTLPGMTSTSLVPKAAKAAGLDFGQLLERIIELAVTPAKDRS